MQEVKMQDMKMQDMDLQGRRNGRQLQSAVWLSYWSALLTFIMLMRVYKWQQ